MMCWTEQLPSNGRSLAVVDQARSTFCRSMAKHCPAREERLSTEPHRTYKSGQWVHCCNTTTEMMLCYNYCTNNVCEGDNIEIMHNCSCLNSTVFYTGILHTNLSYYIRSFSKVAGWITYIHLSTVQQN